MTETPIELELQPSVQPPTPSNPERRLQPYPPPVFHLPLPTQQESHHQQSQLQAELQLSSPEHRHERPVWINQQRLLLLLLALSSCAVIPGLIYYVYQNLQNRSNIQAGAGAPCRSPECQRASAYLDVSADPFSQPCDYFLFTCGSERLSPDSTDWRQGGQGVPGHPQHQRGKAQWSQKGGRKKQIRGLTEEKVLNRKTVLLQYLGEILESNDRPNSTAVEKAKRFYQSCLDIKSIETAGVEPFLALIQKLGGWAVSGEWNQTDLNSTLSLLMRDYSTFPFFNLYVGKGPNEITHGKTKRYIQIDQPDLLIPTEWNSKTETSQAKTKTLRPFLASFQRYLALLGAPPDSSLVHVGLYISLSSQLAVTAAPRLHRLSTGQLYHRMSIKELQSQAPAIDWLSCLKSAFHPLPLIEDDHVFLHNLPYIIQMSRIIGIWRDRTDQNTSGPLHTFMVLNLLHTVMPAMDSRFSQTANSLSLALGRTEEVAPRWKDCVLDTAKGFDLVLTDLLSQRTGHPELEDLIRNIFSSFKSKLHELKWTEEKSLRQIMKRVQSLIPRIWTPKEIFTEDDLDLLFSKVTISTHSFFSNYIQLLSLWQKRRSRLLTERTEAADILSVTPLLLGDELLFPMGMFVPPLFHPTYPRAMNYGVIGFLIAKDILHLILPEIYSQSETVRAVGECVWAHYLNVVENTGRSGGSVSLSAAQRQEVWVQYSALQIALQAYRHSLKNRPSDTSISGLSHTRLFLTSFSQVNCDSDPYREFMPLEPSFLITVICATPDLCSSSLQCPNKTQQHSLQTC